MEKEARRTVGEHRHTARGIDQPVHRCTSGLQRLESLRKARRRRRNLGLPAQARYADGMAFLASTSRTSLSRGSNAALLLGVFAFFGCNDVNGSGAPEDKDGVTEVPTPNGNNSVGTGLVGGGGSSGTGGGVNGQDCLGDPDCDDDDLCTIEFCNPDVNKCVQFDAAEDDNICTMDSCDPRTGTIQNIATPIVDNPCTYDFCDPITGPSNLPYSTIFAEDFTSNAAGWVLE